jgi:hypothetical protein
MKKRIRERVSKTKGSGLPRMMRFGNLSVRSDKKSKSVDGKCVGENSTGGKSGVIRSSGNIFWSLQTCTDNFP